IFLHYQDSRLEPTLALRCDIARVIRQVKPDVVICQDPSRYWSGQGYINHPDHRIAGEAMIGMVDVALAAPVTGGVLANHHVGLDLTDDARDITSQRQRRL